MSNQPLESLFDKKCIEFGLSCQNFLQEKFKGKDPRTREEKISWNQEVMKNLRELVPYSFGNIELANKAKSLAGKLLILR